MTKIARYRGVMRDYRRCLYTLNRNTVRHLPRLTFYQPPHDLDLQINHKEKNELEQI